MVTLSSPLHSSAATAARIKRQICRRRTRRVRPAWSAHPARTLGLKERERVRCSSLVDWPVYLRLRRIMRGQSGRAMRGDAALLATFRRFGHEGSCQVARGLSCPSPVARAREENAGAAGSSERINRPWLVLRRGPDRACPRRPRVRYERAGRSFYSAAAAGGAKMTPAQIAEAQRLTR